MTIKSIAALRKVASGETRVEDYISEYWNIISVKTEMFLAPRWRARCNKEQWLAGQQEEFEFHLRDKWRQSNEFQKHTAVLFEYFGFSKDQYRDCTIIDLGAGSRLRTKYFRQAKIVAIEPLADRFFAAMPRCDLGSVYKVYAMPAEERIAECKETAALLVSINVLDRCYDFEKVVDNIKAYLKPTGLAFLSFDAHRRTGDVAPLILNQRRCLDLFLSKGLRVEKMSTGFGAQNGIIGHGKDTYGFGDHALNYWLTKKA